MRPNFSFRIVLFKRIEFETGVKVEAGDFPAEEVNSEVWTWDGASRLDLNWPFCWPAESSSIQFDHALLGITDSFWREALDKVWTLAKYLTRQKESQTEAAATGETVMKASNNNDKTKV